MKKTICIILATAIAATLQAAVPLAWNVETTRAQPAAFDCYRGETLDLRASLFNAGTALDVSGAANLYWQTNGMGEVYWSAPATAASNVLSATWAPTNDVGAANYNCFIGVAGEIYRAAFRLRMLPSPGAVPSELDLPAKSIDFAAVTVLNAPYYTQGEVDSAIAFEAGAATNYTDSAAQAATNYTDSTASTLRDSIAGKADATNIYTKAETDAKIVELAPAPGNYAAVSNAAMAAKATLEGVFDPEQPTAVPYAVRAENANYASFASDAANAENAQNAASLDGRDGYGIIAQLNAATKTNAQQQAALAGKQDTISDLAAIRSGAALGATALQSYTESDPVWTAEKGGYATTNALEEKQDALTAQQLASIAAVPDKLDKSGGTVTGDLEVVYNNSGFKVKDASGNYLQIRHDTVAGDFWYVNYSVANAGSGSLRLPYDNIIPADVYSLAGWFDTGTTYALNSLCVYGDGRLYRCVNPNGHTGAWVAADFALATIEDVLAALRTDKADASALSAHTGDATIHVTAADKAAWSGKQDILPYATNAIPYAAITGKPTFATVATSGSYNDLTDKPSIPSPTAPVASATLAWQSNGSAIVVSVGAAETLSTTLTGWVDGQTQTALITLAAGASVAANVKLVGYGTWPTGGQFLASATRVGMFVYVTPIVLVN